MRLPRMLAALLFTLVLAAFPAAPAQAAAIGVTTTADELNSDGDCSLREAIRAANLNAAVDACPAGDGADTIALPAGTYTLALIGSDEPGLSALTITDSLTITGALSTTTVIDGGALGRVIDVRSGNVTISGLTVRNAIRGGIVNGNAGVLTLTRSMIADNEGSGLYNSGRAEISDSTFTHNQGGSSIEANGGGIFNAGTMLLKNSAVISNTAGRGGGIMNSRILTISHSLISDNLAAYGTTESGYGGGILNDETGNHSRLFVENSMIVGNRAMAVGGGIYNRNWATLDKGRTYKYDDAQIVNTTIADNIAALPDGSSYNSQGGGIAVHEYGYIIIRGSTLRGNMATGVGGGILVFGGATIDQTQIISNTAFSGGGLISAGTVTVTNSLISTNAAVRGGGIYAASHVQITSSAIISNTATGDGGGIYNSGYNSDRYGTQILTATNSTISGNSAGRHGGGIYNITGTLSLYNATVTHNTADFDNDGMGDGGGVMWASGTVALQNSILGANSDQGGQAGDCAGALISQGYNLIQDTSGCTLTGTTDIVGLPPLLGPLGDNGGPTPTHALLPGSPALDAADPAGCRDSQGTLLVTDQRGVARPQGNACDIGAFESALAPQTVPVHLPLIAGP
jgi:CSLREA domain-containing protein